MPIDYYEGAGSPTIFVTSAKELYEALDILHTQVMDGTIGDASPLLGILETAMDAVELAEGPFDA
jgi:hypothetical protein